MADENNNSAHDLHVMVFAGPNGSGKTSLIDQIRETGLETVKGVYALPAYFINPDQVAKDLRGQFSDQNARDEAAQREAMRVRAQATASKLPFAFETVMSHPSRINEMLILKKQEYFLFLVFITTDDPEKNVARVTMRYETSTTTGHYVQPDKVRDRYARTLALLPKAAEIADAVYIYDNSVDFVKPKLQLVIEREKIFAVSEEAKEWVHRCLVHPLQQREHELDELITTLEQAGYELGDTNELTGAYTGPVLRTTIYYVAQFDERSRLVFIHDRLMLDTARLGTDSAPPAYAQQENLTIRYLQENAPHIERHRQDQATSPGHGMLKIVTTKG